MPYYSYHCQECDNTDMRLIRVEDGVFTEEVLVKSLTKEQVKKLPAWDDPRDYEVYKTKKYGKSPPDTVKCLCGAKAERVVENPPDIKHGRNSWHAMRERKRYAEHGMDKKQAEQFYKESCEASKNRVKSGNQHYKAVVPNYEVLRKQGKVRKLNDKEVEHKVEYLKDANRVLTKGGTIGKKPRKKG